MDKITVIEAAAHLAKEWHQGQVDKAGKDYFEGHLKTVGNAGKTWQEKVVGFLHDAAEDTPHTVAEIMAELKQRVPESVMPTDAEWAEIEEALNLMNHHTVPVRVEYIKRFEGHPLAIAVKLNDLTHNMDLGRLAEPTEKDYARVERYKREYQQLLAYMK